MGRAGDSLGGWGEVKIMGAENVLAWTVRPGWKSSQADSLGKEYAPVCALSYCGEGSEMIDQCEVQDDRVSAARLSVAVDQLC